MVMILKNHYPLFLLTVNYNVMKKSIGFLLIIFFVASETGLIMAQMTDRDQEVFPEQVSIDHNDAVKKFSRDFISNSINVGTEVESLLQSLDMISQLAIVNETGNGNSVRLYQGGYNNFIVAGLEGNSNSLDVEQRGDHNAASFRIRGSYNELDLLQEGSFNTFIRSFNSNFNQGQFSQSGFGLNLQIEGQNSIPLIIEQRGQGSGILIENWD